MHIPAGGKQKGTEGYFVEPTVFGNVQDHFKIAKEVVLPDVPATSKYLNTNEANPKKREGNP